MFKGVETKYALLLSHTMSADYPIRSDESRINLVRGEAMPLDDAVYGTLLQEIVRVVPGRSCSQGRVKAPGKASLVALHQLCICLPLTLIDSSFPNWSCDPRPVATRQKALILVDEAQITPSHKKETTVLQGLIYKNDLVTIPTIISSLFISRIFATTVQQRKRFFSGAESAFKECIVTKMPG